MLDIALIQQAILDLAAAGWIKDLLFDHRMSAELGADPLDQRLLFGCALGGFEFGEQVFDLAMVGLQKCNRVLIFWSGITEILKEKYC